MTTLTRLNDHPLLSFSPQLPHRDFPPCNNPTTAHPREKTASWGLGQEQADPLLGPEEKQDACPDVFSSLRPLFSTGGIGFLPTPERPQTSLNLKFLPYFSSLRGLLKLMETLRLEGPRILFVYLLFTFSRSKRDRTPGDMFFQGPTGWPIYFCSQIE